MEMQAVNSAIFLHILVDDPRVHQGENVEHREARSIELALRKEFLPLDYLCHKKHDRDAKYLIDYGLATDKADALWKVLILSFFIPAYDQVLPEPEQKKHQSERLVHKDARFELPQLILIFDLVNTN